MHCIITDLINNLIKLSHYDETKNGLMAHIQPEQKKTTSRVMVGPAKGKHHAPFNGVKFYARAVIKEETIAINNDWVYNQAYRLSHDIHSVCCFL